jgi:hypothetical protein
MVDQLQSRWTDLKRVCKYSASSGSRLDLLESIANFLKFMPHLLEKLEHDKRSMLGKPRNLDVRVYDSREFDNELTKIKEQLVPYLTKMYIDVIQTV